jgi:hypothetical protein
VIHEGLRAYLHPFYTIRIISNLFSDTVTGRADITMQYVNYEEDIVLAHGVKLVGWTPAKFVNPSELSDAIGPLQELFTAIKNGTCKFVKLTPQEHIDRKQKYDADVAAGRCVAKHRQPRNNIGRKRKAAEGSRGEMLDEDEDEDNGVFYTHNIYLG